MNTFSLNVSLKMDGTISVENEILNMNGHEIMLSSDEGSAGICLKCGRGVREKNKGGAEQLFLLSNFISDCKMSDAPTKEHVGRKLILGEKFKGMIANTPNKEIFRQKVVKKIDETITVNK